MNALRTLLTALRGIPATAVALVVSACAIQTVEPPSRPASTAPRAATSSRQIDPSQAERLQRIMIPLVRNMDRPLPLTDVRVGIIDDGSINAANAGGGEFYVTTGLLERARDQQLGGVLAHELAHADLGHVAKAQALGAGLNVGVIILDQIIPGSRAITPIAGELIARAYSRQEEFAADAHGARILNRAGYEGRRAMADTLSWLQSIAGPSGGGFLSTHPATGDRIQALRSGG